MLSFIDSVFVLNVAINLAMLVGTVWSVASPSRRFWPPPRRGSWQFWLTWALFYLAFALNFALFIFDWNSWIFASNVRFVLGIPLLLLGGLLVGWGVITLGVRNSSGISAGLISAGPYAFTRNPQYLGDMILFVGLSLIANSLYLWATHLLLILVFAIVPLAEEIWLTEQYGEAYEQYKLRAPRFI